MLFANFRRWLNRGAQRAKQIRKPVAARRFRPTIELLEDRLAPAVLTVNTLFDTSGGANLSLRDAIIAVNSSSTAALTTGEAGQVAGLLGQNDTIVFAAGLSGTMSLTAGLPVVSANVQILGSGPGQLTIDGGGQCQIFSVSAPQVAIAGLTLANGRANGTDGGAIDATGTSLTVSNCAFTGNQASVAGSDEGGAISSFGNLTITNCTFTSNSAYDGGAINSGYGGSTTLTNDSFTGNSGDQIGGAIVYSGPLAVENCTFTSNSVGPTALDMDGAGGAIGASGVAGADLMATDDTFIGNISYGTTSGNTVGGGAIADLYGALDIAGCTFANNTSKTVGGAVDVEETTSAVIVDSTFTGNSAISGTIAGGGGLYLAAGPVQLTNDTICANITGGDSGGAGGGIDVVGGANVTLDNTIVAGNTAKYPTYDIAGTVVAASANNLIGDSNSAGGLTSTDGNHNLVGVAADLLPLGTYGGPTQTMLPAAGSPAIDAGSTAFVTDQATDQRGFSRTSGKDGAHVDIGAVEVQAGGVGTHLELQGPATASVGAAMSWIATALDDNNLPAYTAFGPIVMSVAAGPAKFTGSSTTLANAVYGSAAFNNLTLYTPGYYTIQASFGNSSISAPLVVNGGGIDFLTQPFAKIMAGNAIGSIQVAVVDTLGKPINGDNDSITLTLLDVPAGVASAYPAPFSNGQNTVTMPLQNGVATFNNLFVDKVAAGGPGANYLLEASAGDLRHISHPFVVLPAAASQLVFVQQPPATVTAGTVISPAPIVAVEDKFGNVVTTNTSQVTLTVAGPHTYRFALNTVQGLATFTGIGVFVHGTYTVTATDGSLTVATALTSLVADPFVGPSQSAVVNTKYATPLYAKVTDISGNPLAGMIVTFTAPATGPGGTFGGYRTVTERTNAAGIATAPAFTANTKAGDFVVTVGFNDDAPPETIALTNLAGPPTHLTLIAGTPQSAVVDTGFATSLAAKVTDRFGNPVTGASVTFTAPASNASGAFTGNLASLTVLTNSLGVASAPAFTAKTKVGSYTVVATVSDVAVGVKYHLTNKVAPPAILIVGPAESAIIGAVYAHRLTAQVTDAYGNPVSGVAVTFTAPASGPGGTFAKKKSVIALTNAVGIATAPAFTANAITGEFVVDVSALGAPSGSIQLTNLPRPA